MVKACLITPQTQWMMYWIVFALFQAAEVVTDTFISWYVWTGGAVGMVLVES